jgi:rhodanese-related sulfurtransferase
MGGKEIRVESEGDGTMKQLWSRLTINHKLAAAAFVLGALALVAGNPYRGHTATLNVKELGLMVEKELDHVTVDELADAIIKGKADYRLIDVRSAKEFDEYHIPTAENIPLASLADAGLQRNEKIILYSEGGIHSAQAWFLLKALQYKHVYMLKDGLNEWKDRILFPTLSENASAEEKAEFEKRKAVSLYFGGTPRTGSTAMSSAPQLVMPKLEQPSASATPTAAPKKKKKEGC